MKSPETDKPRAVCGRRRLALALSLLVFVAACAPGTKTDPDASLMQEGLGLLNTAGDPAGAAAVFRVVLSRTPSHYGARYQLAVALDRCGKPAEARPEWEQVKRLAEASADQATLKTATARLAARDTVSEDVIQAAMMSVGMNLLGRQSRADLAAATKQFSAVLERNPAHYGATYQLAEAYERMGQRAAARPLWERALAMATAYKDDRTIQLVRARLK